MKKTFKIKALVLCMIAMMVIGLVPSVQAARYENDSSVTEKNADIVCSLMADKTDVKPGDVVTVTFTLDKVPAGGVVAINTRLLYDSTKLSLNKYNDRYNYVVPGEVAEALGYRVGKDAVADDPDVENAKVISYGMAEDVDFTCTETGTIMTYKFTVTDNASGKIDMYLKSIAEGGLSLSSTKEGNDGMINVDTDVVTYLKTNLDEVEVKVPATGVKFEGIDGVTLDTASNNQLSVLKYVVIDPTNTTDTMSWSTEDSKVATVDSNGVVTAVGKGKTNIVVRVGNYTAKLPVSVTVPLTGVEFDGITSVELDVTNNKTLDISNKVKLLPAGAEAAGYEWTTDDASVATVANGVVTAVGKGTTKVNVKVGNFTASLPVTVTASVASISFNVEKIVLDTESNKTFNLKDAVVTNPADADVKSFSATSSDSNVAWVMLPEGHVVAKGKGTATITVTVDGKTATIPVTVTVPLKGIEVDKTDVEVYKGDTAKVVVTTTPEEAEWSTLDASFRSGNENATVKSVADGVEITGLKEGSSVITVAANKATTGDLVKLVNVVVKENRVTGIDVTVDEDTDILRGTTKQLNVNYTTEEPETVHKTTDDTTVTWKSSDETIATVDENGVVTGHKEGDFTITATMAGHTATYKGTVTEVHADGVIFTEETIAELEKLEAVLVGDRVEIPFEISPEGCTDTVEEILEYVKTEFDEELVDVEVTYDAETQKGVLTVTAKKAGEALVIVVGGEISDDPEEEQLAWIFGFNITEPVVEEETPPETGDIPVALFAGIMAISLAGIVVSKKVLVK